MSGSPPPGRPRRPPASPQGLLHRFPTGPLRRSALHGIPGATTSCWLLAALAVMVAVFSDDPHFDPVFRTLWFAVLSGFFQGLASRLRQRPPQPLGWIALGFGLLTIGHGIAAAIRLSGLDGTAVWDLLAAAMERGPIFLLGLALISFGILGWVPQMLSQQRELQVDVQRTQGELRLSQQARERLEQRMVEAERLRTTGELAAGVAHDLRNPLAIVKATAESLIRRDRPLAERREHAEVILRNVDKATRTISSMLDLGRPRPPSVGVVQAAQLMRDVLGLVSVEARRRKVALQVATDSHNPELLMDEGLAVQALLNLVLNAIQFSPAGAIVMLRIRRVSIGPVRGCVLAVADRGPGLPPEARNRVFRPFFTTRENGTGLGLLSARSLAERMGGRLGLTPRASGGCRALLVLPLAESDDADGAAGPAACGHATGQHSQGEPVP